MGQAPIDAVLALDDRRRPQPHAAALARRLGVLGDVPVTIYEVSDAAPGPLDVVDLIGHRDGGILVMDVHAGGLPGDRLFDDDAEAAIGSGRMAVLAIGPHASTPRRSRHVDHRRRPQRTSRDAALDFGARWRNTFSPPEVAVVMLDAPSGWCEHGEVDDVALATGSTGWSTTWSPSTRADRSAPPPPSTTTPSSSLPHPSGPG